MLDDFRNVLPASCRWGDPRVRIAILDGAVDRDHPCFAGARLEVLDHPLGMDGGAEAVRHGTHVASIVFGQPGGEVVGIAPACTGLIVPIFGVTGRGGPACSQLDLARAILLAVDAGAHLINVSSGQLADTAEPEALLEQALRRAAAANVLIVAAAGNDGCACLHVPAGSGTVLAVGAMDGSRRPLASSNWSPAYQEKGLLAPGSDIAGAVPGGGTVARSGTSYAAPHVTGLAALLLGLQLAAGRPADPHAVRRALLDTADRCPEGTAESCDRYLAGIVNFERAAATVAGALVRPTTNEGGSVMAEEMEWKQVVPAGLPPQPAAGEQAGLVGATGRISMPPEATMADAHSLAHVAATASERIVASDCGCGCGGKEKAEAASGDCGCGCGGAKKKPQLVYALGTLGLDFGTEARRDSLLQAMSMMPGEANTAEEARLKLLAYLDASPFDAPSVIWTLNLDATPIYAIQPVGAFAAEAYQRLREALRAQIEEGVELISVPGVIAGSQRLQSGQVVPIVVPAMRGIYSWATKPLVEHVLGAVPQAEAEAANYQRVAAGVTNYLDRVYYDLRNLGITGEERALNYSATNAVQIASVIRASTLEALDLDRIAVRKSPVCRPDSDCFDVELSFFNPDNTNTANRVFRFTVDVSDIIPVTIGRERSWTRRA